MGELEQSQRTVMPQTNCLAGIRLGTLKKPPNAGLRCNTEAGTHCVTDHEIEDMQEERLLWAVRVGGESQVVSLVTCPRKCEIPVLAWLMRRCVISPGLDLGA
jgi:hypothetical protein